MPRLLPLFLPSVLLAATCAGAAEFDPLALHPENPHYFLWRGRPTVLITSGEHYGAVLNRAFDFRRYLATLQSDGLNLTRTFSGAYCESARAFNIERNTLAPAQGDLICPWARSERNGYAHGGNKFDLTRWDPAYFQRLTEFVAEAGRRGIVVELVLRRQQIQADREPESAGVHLQLSLCQAPGGGGGKLPPQPGDRE